MAGKGFSFSLGAKKAPMKAPKVAKVAVFAPDSDDEAEEVAAQDNKRQRTNSSEGAGPRPPEDPEIQRTADKLAEFVAKHGRSFEDVTRQRNPQGGPFRFLFDTGSIEYKYYEHKVATLRAGITQSSFSAAGPPPPPAPPPLQPAPASVLGNTMAVLNAPAGLAAALQPPSSGAVAEEAAAAERLRAKAALQTGDSLAAMEAFTRLAAKQEETKEEKEVRVPLLNETGFDRRRQLAVYKQDGSRGHHMGDYIPPEELAKFLSKSGNAADKAQAEAMEAASRIQADNIGHKLLSKMGWKEGQGLGAQASGIAAPVAAGSGAGMEKRGLGAEEHGSLAEGDDEFEVYRKRMMLGYKHRPNPLGNPRKQYY